MENNTWKEIIRDILITLGVTVLIIVLAVIATAYIASGDPRIGG